MKTKNTIIPLLYKQIDMHASNRPFIVALDGLSGAGKTTLVEQLYKTMPNCIILHIDDYIVERDKRYDTGNPQWYEYYQLQWDTDALKNLLFEKLSQNHKLLQLPFNMKEEDTHIMQTQFPFHQIVSLSSKEFSYNVMNGEIFLTLSFI